MIEASEGYARIKIERLGRSWRGRRTEKKSQTGKK